MQTAHPHPIDRAKSVEWAKGVLADASRYAILDSETTGLDPTDEVIQLAVLGLDGTTRLNTYVKPLVRKQMPPGAMAIHHITMAMLANTHQRACKPRQTNRYSQFSECPSNPSQVIRRCRFRPIRITQSLLSFLSIKRSTLVDVKTKGLTRT